MNSDEYESVSRSWEFIERQVESHQSRELSRMRRLAKRAGVSLSSTSQTRFITFLAQLLHARHVVLIGDGLAMEAVSLLPVLPTQGSLVVVDQDLHGISFIRDYFAHQSSQVKAKAFSATVSTYLSHLNTASYDMIVVSGSAMNYRAARLHARELLSAHGVLVYTNVLGTAHQPRFGVTNPADRSAKTVELRKVLSSADSDANLDSSLLSIGTGLLICSNRSVPKPAELKETLDHEHAVVTPVQAQAQHQASQAVIEKARALHHLDEILFAQQVGSAITAQPHDEAQILSPASEDSRLASRHSHAASAQEAASVRYEAVPADADTSGEFEEASRSSEDGAEHASAEHGSTEYTSDAQEPDEQTRSIDSLTFVTTQELLKQKRRAQHPSDAALS